MSLATPNNVRRTNRPAGAGTLEQLPSGRWRFRITGPDGKRRTSPSFGSREEAQRVLDAATTELGAAGLAPVGPVTLGGYAEAWLGRRNVRSVDDERRLWRGHVGGTALAAMSIAEVKRRHVRDFVEQLTQKKKLVARRGGHQGERVESDECLSSQTVKLTLALVRRVFAEAIVDELIVANPCAGYRLPKGTSVDADLEERWTFLAADEIDRLLRCSAVPAAARVAYEVAIYTGLRQGELWGLRWADVSLDGPHPECSVRRSYEGPTKGHKVRRFPLLPAAAAALRRVRERATDTSPEALVFPGPRGGCYAEGHDAGWARRNRSKAGIREEVTFHSFRHTCASHLVMGTWGRKWTLAEVQSYLGHSSINVTERYAHLAPGHLAEMASATSSGVTTHGQPSVGDPPSPSEITDESACFLNSRSRVRTAPRSSERDVDPFAPGPSCPMADASIQEEAFPSLTALLRLHECGSDPTGRSSTPAVRWVVRHLPSIDGRRVPVSAASVRAPRRQLGRVPTGCRSRGEFRERRARPSGSRRSAPA